MKVIILAMLFILAACAPPETRHVVDTVEVKVPVLERAAAPAELFRPKLDSSLVPRWVAPSDPAASSCVTQTGEPLLKSIMLGRESLLDGWESYGAR